MPAKTSLGLYFTDQYIEVSELSGDGRNLEKYNFVFLPAGLVVGGEIKNSDAFTQLLGQLLASAKPSAIDPNQEAVIGVSDNKIFLREFNVLKLSGKDINEAIDYQVRVLLPVLPAGVVTDSQIIGRNEDGHIEVLLAAVPDRIIDSYVNTCLSVGLRVVAVEPAVFANIRALNQDHFKGKNQILVYLGDTFGSFSFVTSGNPRFSDFLSLGEIEKNGGVLRTVLSYITFANSKSPSRQVQEVIVSGFSETVDRAVAEMKEQKINAVKAVGRLISKQPLDHILTRTAIGLSLKMTDVPPTLNLLPIEYRLRVIHSRMTSSWKMLLNMMILITILALGGLGYFYSELIARQTRLVVQKDQYERQFSSPESQELIQKTNELNTLTRRLFQLRSITGGEENIMRTLMAVTPPEVSLTSVLITRNPGSTKLLDIKNSWIFTGTANTRPVVLGFYNSLLTQPNFSEGRLYFGSLEKDVGLNFRIANQPRP